MISPFRIAAFVSHIHGAAVLDALLDMRDLVHVVLVATDDPISPVCNPDRRLWRYSRAEELRLLVPRLADQAGLSAWTKSVKDDRFHRLFVEVGIEAIVTTVFGQRVPKRLLDEVQGRAWNVHPVLPGLPLAFTKGSTPFEESLHRKAPSIQFCLHRMTEVIDQGEEEARSKPFELPRVADLTTETYLDLERRSVFLSADVVRDNLPRLLSQALPNSNG